MIKGDLTEVVTIKAGTTAIGQEDLQAKITTQVMEAVITTVEAAMVQAPLPAPAPQARVSTVLPPPPAAGTLPPVAGTTVLRAWGSPLFPTTTHPLRVVIAAQADMETWVLTAALIRTSMVVAEVDLPVSLHQWTGTVADLSRARNLAAMEEAPLLPAAVGERADTELHRVIEVDTVRVLTPQEA